MADRELRRQGLFLDDPEVIEAMETPGEEGMRFLPLRISSKTGAISSEILISAARMGRLKHHIEGILKEICGEIASGNIDADPFWRGPEKNACRYCDYAAACQFEEGMGGDRRRYLPPIDNEHFWEKIETDDSGQEGLRPGSGERKEEEYGCSSD